MTANSHIDINSTGRLSSNREISYPLYSGDRIFKWHFQKEILKTLTFKISTYTQHALVSTKASILSKAITLLRIQIDMEIFVLFFSFGRHDDSTIEHISSDGHLDCLSDISRRSDTAKIW